jgi:hypothetical protein
MKSATSVESRSRAHHRWILGRYVQLISIFQLVVYATAAFAREPHPALPVFDPRFLVYVSQAITTSGPHPFPAPASWLSACAMLCVGEGVVRSRSGLVFFVAVEGVYAALFMAMTVLIVAANLPPSHGISPRELIVPFAVFTVASAGPLMAALPLWRAPDYGD